MSRPHPTFTDRTLVRVIFSQTRGDYVTASLRHATGPLIVGERVVAYEVDEPRTWTWAEVADFDETTGVALLSVEKWRATPY